MPAIPIVAAVAGGAIAASGAKKAANTAAEAAKYAVDNSKVDITALQKQAQQAAIDNAANSAALEDKYNPGASALRKQSLTNLTQSLQPNLQVDTIANKIAAQAGAMPTGIGYDSPLLRDAIAKATADLQLGGQLPQDVRNLVMRQALAKSGTVSGGLNLGRDIGVRDLGLTSLDLENRRLQNAAALGEAEAGLGQGNANLSLQAQLAGQNNLFNSGSFLQSLANGEFSKQLAAAQFGQNIAQPVSGLDPGSIANLAVGNQNAQNNAVQNASAQQVAAANQKSAFGGQILGIGLNGLSNYFKPTVATPAISPSSTPQGSYSVPFYAMK